MQTLIETLNEIERRMLQAPDQYRATPAQECTFCGMRYSQLLALRTALGSIAFLLNSTSAR